MFIFFLNLILLVNLALSFYKKNADFIGYSFGLLILISIAERLKKKKLINLPILNNRLFHTLLIFNVLNLMSVMYSNGLDAKIYRFIEYGQSLFLLFVFKLPRIKNFKKFIPHVLLTYLLIPPGSILLDTSGILNSYALVIIFVILIFLLRNVKSNIFQSASISFWIMIGSLFFILPALSVTFNPLKYNLIEYTFHFVLSLLSVLALLSSIKRQKEWQRFLTLLNFLFTFKIVYIAYYPETLATRGGVNSNLFAISFEFLLLSSVYLALVSRDKIFRISQYLIFFILSIAIYKLNSRTAAIAIIYALAFAILFFLLIKSNGNKNRKIIYALLLFHFMFLILLFVYLFKFSHLDSILIRVKLWNIALTGICENPYSLLIGLSDIGKINLLNLVTPFIANELKTYPNLFDSGMFQTHLHSDYLAFLYGIGILGLTLYLLLIVRSLIIATKNSNINMTYLSIIIIISFSVHSLTEPIFTNIYTSFLFILPVLIIDNRNHNGVKNNQLDGGNKNFILSILLIFSLILVIYNIKNNSILRYSYIDSHFKKEVRGFSAFDSSLQDEKNKALNETIRQINSNSMLRFKGIGILENEADIFLKSYLLNGNKDLIHMAELRYCELFKRQQIPRHYNNLKNLSKITKVTLIEFCQEEQKSFIQNYDKYYLISEEFY